MKVDWKLDTQAAVFKVFIGPFSEKDRATAFSVCSIYVMLWYIAGWELFLFIFCVVIIVAIELSEL